MKIRIVDSYKMLREMADGLQDIKRDLRNCANTLRDHLMLIYLFPDNINVNHWMNEVAGACNSVSKAKHNNKYPKSNFIFENLWGYWEDGFFDKYRNRVADLEDKENLIAEKFVPEELYQFLSAYYRWLSDNLSQCGDVSRAQVKSELNELLLEFRRY